MDIENSETSIKSLKRVQEYPLIKDSLTKAGDYYNWIKDKNSILKSTLTYTEDSLKCAINRVEPFASSKLGTFDQFANNQLDNLETKFPIIKESSESILASTNMYYDATVKPKVDTILNVKDNVVYIAKAPFRITSKTVEYLSSTTNTFVARFLSEIHKSKDSEKKDLQKKEYDVLFGRALKEINSIRHYARSNIEGLTNLLISTYNKSVSINQEIINKYYQEYIDEIKVYNENEQKNSDLSLMGITNLLTNKLRISIRAMSTVCYNHLSNDNKIKMNLIFDKTELLYKAVTKSTERDIHEKFVIDNVKWIDENTAGLLDNVQESIVNKYKEDVGEEPLIFENSFGDEDFNCKNEDSNSEAELS